VREIAAINRQQQQQLQQQQLATGNSQLATARAMPFMPAAAATTVIVTIKLANDIKARQG